MKSVLHAEFTVKILLMDDMSILAKSLNSSMQHFPCLPVTGFFKCTACLMKPAMSELLHSIVKDMTVCVFLDCPKEVCQ